MGDWRHNDGVNVMPEQLRRFRPFEWLAGEWVGDPDFDVDGSYFYALRPRTEDRAVLMAYTRFRAARASWEAEHPEYVRKQIADQERRRQARRETGKLALPRDYYGPEFFE